MCLEMEWGTSTCGKYRIESLTVSTIPGALKVSSQTVSFLNLCTLHPHRSELAQVIKDGFFPDEMVCIGTEVNMNPAAGEELLELCADAALDGVSLVAVEISTGDVVSACFNKLQVASTNADEKTFFDEFVEERCNQPSSKALINFMSDVDSRCNFFERYGVDCSLEIMFIATLREHRQKKLGYLLFKYSLEVGKRLKTGPISHITLQDLGSKYSYMKPRKVTAKIPKICQAIGTSTATQKIGAALNFTVHLRVPFTEFKYNGKNYVERNGFDPYCEGIARPLE